MARLDRGDPIFIVLDRAAVMARKSRSQSARSSSSPWSTDEEAMWTKTAIRALWTWLPKTAEMATAGNIEDILEAGKRPQVEAFPEEVTAILTGVVGVEPEPDEIVTHDVEPEHVQTEDEAFYGKRE